jgi:hypothetical protein
MTAGRTGPSDITGGSPNRTSTIRKSVNQALTSKRCVVEDVCPKYTFTKVVHR